MASESAPVGAPIEVDTLLRSTASFDGRVLLLSGAGPGLGRSIVERFAARGARLVLGARTASSLETLAQVASAYGAEVICVPTDATDASSVAALVSAAAERFGQIDAVVNAVRPPHEALKPVVELDDSELAGWQRTVDVSILSAMLLARASARMMIPARSGSIVNVTASSALQGAANISGHVCGKAAVHILSQCLAAELGPFGIRVNCVAPYLFRDGPAETALGRSSTAEEVAECIYFLSAAHSSGITGQVICANAGRIFH